MRSFFLSILITLLASSAVLAGSAAFFSCQQATPPMFTPAALANLWGWYDAASTYVTLDGSNNVITWADRSGNGRDFVNTTATSNRPGWSSSVINGKPALTAAGGAWLNLASAWPNPVTIFYVFKNANDAGLQGLAADTDSPDHWNFSSNSLAMGIFSSQLFIASAIFNFAGSPGTVTNIWTVENDFNSVMNSWLNGSQTLTGAGGFHGLNPNIILMAGYTGQWNGSLAEVVIYSDTKNSTDRTAVENYLNAKYAAF